MGMKIFIAGNSASGKSTMARKLSKIYSLDLCHLDDIVWENGKKRSHEKRKNILTNFLAAENWVIEGMSHSEWMHAVYKQADYIFLLNTNYTIASFRVLKRYFKKKIGIEKGHKETLKSVKNLLKIRKDYEKNIIPEIKETMETHKHKSFVIKNIKQIQKIINSTLPPKPRHLVVIFCFII